MCLAMQVCTPYRGQGVFCRGRGPAAHARGEQAAALLHALVLRAAVSQGPGHRQATSAACARVLPSSLPRAKQWVSGGDTTARYLSGAGRGPL
jgi:hypothetical protein